MSVGEGRVALVLASTKATGCGLSGGRSLPRAAFRIAANRFRGARTGVNRVRLVSTGVDRARHSSNAAPPIATAGSTIAT